MLQTFMPMFHKFPYYSMYTVCITSIAVENRLAH